MPRKRMIDPEFWSDEEIGEWSFEARLFYIALWNFADDEGKFKANEALLKAQIFPYDDDIDFDSIKKFLASKVLWYEICGLSYGYIRNFNKYQRIDRPTISRIPNPSSLDESSTSPRGSLDPNISKDNISKDKSVPMVSFDFESLIEKYPNKDGTKKAKEKFHKTVRNQKDWLDINTALTNYLNSSRVKNGYVKNASTWFNNWSDWVSFKETVRGDDKPKGALSTSVRKRIVC